MKIRRKTNRCLNCGHTLGEIYNFCPHCGQENNDQNVTFKHFVSDFFANYFSFDSRIGRSIKPLFLQPGFLTNRFNEGQRMQYVHPLRLYLVVSLIFFFLLSLSTKFEMNDRGELSSGFIQVRSDTTNKSPTEKIMADESLSDQQVFDSLRAIGETDLPQNWFTQRLFGGARKIQNRGGEWFVNSFMQNLPFALLIAMPVLALLLKGFYFRHQYYYVQHLVHTLHLHSVALLLFSLFLIVALALGIPSEASDQWLEPPIVLLLVYVFFSFKKVYQQRGWVTLLKLSTVALVYSLVLGLTIVGVALLAFLNF